MVKLLAVQWADCQFPYGREVPKTGVPNKARTQILSDTKRTNYGGPRHVTRKEV